MTLHRHHKIPRHMGGTDDPSNIEFLTIEQHANAHKILFEKFGREEDRIAWLGLQGMIGRDEIIRRLQILGGKNSAKENTWSKTKTRSNWKINAQNQRKAEMAAHSATASEKRKKTYAEKLHQQKELNSAYGTSIYRDAVGNRRRFKRGTQPDGWILSKEWVEQRKNKKNNTYGKQWFNDGVTNFLLAPDDKRVKELTRGRINLEFERRKLA